MKHYTTSMQKKNEIIIEDSIIAWVDAFLHDKKLEGVKDGSIRFYRFKLKLFLDYCTEYNFIRISEITSSFIRQFLFHLEETDHNLSGLRLVVKSKNL